MPSAVELDLKNRQDKNQITNDPIDKISIKSCQNKNKLTLRAKIAVTKKVLKAPFDCLKK